MRLVGQWVFLVAIVFPVVLAAQLKFTTTHYTSGDRSTASTVTGDFNGDGILDPVSVNQTSLSFFKGLGGGKFAAAVNQALPQNVGQVVAADFNGDGKA